MKRNEREVTSIDAAIRAGESRERIIRKIQAGVLRGRRDPERGWLLLETSLQAYLRRRSEIAAESRPEPSAAP